jgi:hydroxymethylglutaryl-CoA lyase
VSASETHNQKNVRRSVAESLVAARDVVEIGHDADLPVEAIVSTAFGCPYEGDVAPERVAQVAGHLLDAGADRLSFGDTTGMATPRRVDDLLDALAHAGIALDRIGLHFHDTRGTALANVVAALERGITRFDASIGGLGGCPYAPGASGNAVTEDLVHMLRDMNIETGVDLDALLACAALAQDIVGRELPSALLHAGPRTRRYAS